MTDLFLIAHKVRGEAAFDIAIQMECPICHDNTRDAVSSECAECDSEGFWWIVPTSGHRAYPWLYNALSDFTNQDGFKADDFATMPDGWPDHYPTRATPDAPKLDIAALMPKSAPIRRRV